MPPSDTDQTTDKTESRVISRPNSGSGGSRETDLASPGNSNIALGSGNHSNDSGSAPIAALRNDVPSVSFTNDGNTDKKWKDGSYVGAPIGAGVASAVEAVSDKPLVASSKPANGGSHSRSSNETTGEVGGLNKPKGDKTPDAISHSQTGDKGNKNDNGTGHVYRQEKTDDNGDKHDKPHNSDKHDKPNSDKHDKPNSDKHDKPNNDKHDEDRRKPDNKHDDDKPRRQEEDKKHDNDRDKDKDRDRHDNKDRDRKDEKLEKIHDKSDKHDNDRKQKPDSEHKHHEPKESKEPKEPKERDPRHEHRDRDGRDSNVERNSHRNNQRDVDQERERNHRRDDHRDNDSEFSAKRLQALLREAENRLVKPGDMKIFNKPEPELPKVKEIQKPIDSGKDALEAMRRAQEMAAHSQQQKPLPQQPVIRTEEHRPVIAKPQEQQPVVQHKIEQPKVEAPHKDLLTERKPVPEQPEALKAQQQQQNNSLRAQLEAAIKNIKPERTVEVETGPDMVPANKNGLLTPDQIQAMLDADEEDEKKKLQGKNVLQPQKKDDNFQEPETKPVKDQQPVVQTFVPAQQIATDRALDEEKDVEEEDIDNQASNPQFNLSATSTNNQPTNNGQQPNGNSAYGSGMPGVNGPHNSPIDPKKVLPGLQIHNGKTQPGSKIDFNDILNTFFNTKQPDQDKIDKRDMWDQLIARMGDRKQRQIKPGETLEDIAREEFGDTRLADLIYRMNSARIPTKILSADKLRVKLIPHTKLIIPTEDEVKQYVKDMHKMRRRRFEYETTRSLVAAI